MILDALKLPLISCFQSHKTWYTPFYPPLTVILYKRLEIEESVQQKMGAEQRRLNRYEQAP